jgi:hypothetical protein
MYRGVTVTVTNGRSTTTLPRLTDEELRAVFTTLLSHLFHLNHHSIILVRCLMYGIMMVVDELMCCKYLVRPL